MEALRKMVLAYYSRAKEHPDELKIHSQAASEIGDKAIRAQLRRDYQNYMRFVEQVIDSGITQEAIRADVDVEAMAFLYTGGAFIVNMLLLALDKRFGEQLLVRMSDHLLGALKA